MLAALPLPLPFVILAVCAALAAWSDLHARRIPNKVVLPGLAAALLAAAYEYGWTAGIQPALIGAAVGLGLALPFYFFRALGAGDAKLLMLVGASVGASGVVQIAGMSFCIAAALGLAMSAIHGRLPQYVANLREGAYALATRDLDAATDVSNRTAYRVPFAVAVLFAVALWIAVLW